MATNDSNKSTEPTAAELAKQKVADADKAAPAKAKVVETKGDLKVAVNLIVQTGTDGKPEEVQPGSTFYPAKIDVDFLVKHEAVREPTETERVMHERVEELQRRSAASANDTLG